jgi:hypothetical protein
MADRRRGLVPKLELGNEESLETMREFWEEKTRRLQIAAPCEENSNGGAIRLSN